MCHFSRERDGALRLFRAWNTGEREVRAGVRFVRGSVP
jgi:hypothetical protein